MKRLIDIFGFKFDSKPINVFTESDSWIEQYKNEYLKVNDESEDCDAVDVFEETRKFIHSFDEKQILKQMKKQRMNIDMFTLNVLQNMALVKVQNGDGREFIKQFGPTYEARKVYYFINTKKLELHYISPLQYDENERLMKELSHRIF